MAIGRANLNLVMIGKS